MKHFTEADLLETYYTGADESTPAMLHLGECSECAARYERLERNVRGLAACDQDKPETFWVRQRMSIMRRIEGERRRSPIMKYAAAAMLTLTLGGGVVTLNRQKVAPGPGDPIERAKISIVTSDPWQSDELKDYQPVVAWESWVEEDQKKGDQS